MASKLRRGVWFHSTKNFLIHNQGQVLRVLPNGTFRIQLYSFMFGDANGVYTVPRSYFDGALFYKTDKEMRAAYDKDYSPYADRRPGESSFDYHKRKQAEGP
jgi:hypothetical protein